MIFADNIVNTASVMTFLIYSRLNNGYMKVFDTYKYIPNFFILLIIYFGFQAIVYPAFIKKHVQNFKIGSRIGL